MATVTELLAEDTQAAPGVRASGLWLYNGLFFLSGFPALIYQIVWQRALFTLYGVDIESVTVIVTVFMLGLGLGSLAGGWLSTRRRIRPLLAFGLIESTVGLLGFDSLRVFRWAGALTAGHSLIQTGLFTFVLLLLPTLLMGSTLPLLAEYVTRQTGNVGQSVGSLYCVNTLGSGIACLVSALFLMRWTGETGAARVACFINLAVGIIACLASLRDASPDAPAATGNIKAGNANIIPFKVGLALAGVIGFIALAYEIIWYRLYAFATGGTAPCFALMLGFYLVGIAYGSFAARGLSKKNDSRGVLKAAASAVLFGSIASYLLGPVLARAIHYLPYQSTLALVFACASMLGSAFPLLAHAAIDPDDETGKKLSFLYLSNIIGSTLGSFLVGFLLLNKWSTAATSALLLGLGFAAYAALGYLARPAIKTFAMVTGCVVCTALAVASRPIYSGLYERLLAKDSQPGPPFANLVENRSGVIAVTNDGTVYGGGAYDGRFNTNLVHDTNALFRAFAVAGLHPHPARMLIIGLSSGSWVQVVANDPAVKDITVVEINPGYLPLIDERSSVRSLRSNPKVHIVIDDGRRWLMSHPDEKFDFVLINSTFYWRANASNLLSREFLQLVRRHLAPGGIEYYNTTWSPRVVATAVAVFPYTMRFANFMAVSDSPFSLDKDRWREALIQYRIDGKPVLDLAKPEDRARLDQLMDFANPGGSGSMLEMGDRLARDVQQVPIITDDNMGSEWELGR